MEHLAMATLLLSRASSTFTFHAWKKSFSNALDLRAEGGVDSYGDWKMWRVLVLTLLPCMMLH
jgi:hypothetical protein